MFINLSATMDHVWFLTQSTSALKPGECLIIRYRDFTYITTYQYNEDYYTGKTAYLYYDYIKTKPMRLMLLQTKLQ